MIYITGDTHGTFNRFSKKNMDVLDIQFKAGDYIIICGDCGLVWDIYSYKTIRWWNNWFKEKGVTLLFIDGNHENHDMLNDMDVINKFDGKVHKINSHIYHLMRGEVYNIEGKTIFCMGGAKSVDREYRVNGKTWWSDELPSQQEYNNAYENIYKTNHIDYIITHTAPSSLVPLLIDSLDTNIPNELTIILDDIYNNVKFSKWYCGHFHKDTNVTDNFRCLYYDIIKLGDD